MLQQRLDDTAILLADGATGTNLFEMGLTSGDSPELWNDIHPDRIARLHKSFIDAGADIILTNSFGCNARRLMLHDLHPRTRALNRQAAEIARNEAEKSDRRVIIAGSVGPTGDLFAPLGALTEEEAVDIFTEQMEGLKAGGADVFWIETMSAPEEMRAAAMAAARVSMPYTITASFDTAGKTMMGMKPESLAEFGSALVPPPVAVGANCGVGAADLVVSVLAMAEGGLPVIAKANAGIPQFVGEHIRYSGTAETMALYAKLAIDAGARIIGGCCGTSPAHLAAMRRAIDTHEKGARPELAEVIAALGALVAPASTATTGKRANRRSGA